MSRGQVGVKGDDMLQQARRLVLQYGWNAMSYQILNPGFRLWFSQDEQAVVGYVVAGGYWVAAGAPICAGEQLVAVARAFAQAARQAGCRVCYFGAQDRFLAALREEGPVSTLLLGAQPLWNPEAWPGIVAGKSSLRAQLSRARNKGVSVRLMPASEATNNPELRRCLHEWLDTRGLPSMHFLVEPDTLGRVLDRKVFVAERQGQIVGWLNASPMPLRRGWLVEQMIRSHSAPNGTIELLLDTAMRHVAAEGAEYVTLGLSPLSHSLAEATPPPLLMRLALRWARAHGQRFYNFQGLDRFKAKFSPASWEPIYAITTTESMPLQVLYAIAGAFSGESPVRFMSRAVWRAFTQELRWSAARIAAPIRSEPTKPETSGTHKGS